MLCSNETLETQATGWMWSVGQSLPASASDGAVAPAESTMALWQDDSRCGLRRCQSTNYSLPIHSETALAPERKPTTALSPLFTRWTFLFCFVFEARLSQGKLLSEGSNALLYILMQAPDLAQTCGKQQPSTWVSLCHLPGNTKCIAHDRSLSWLFDHNIGRHGFLFIYPVWDTWYFLNLLIHSSPCHSNIPGNFLHRACNSLVICV